MRAEVNRAGPDELIVDLRSTELSDPPPPDAGIRKGLPGMAGQLADAVTQLLSEPPQAGGPADVRVITLRIVRPVVIAEISVPLAEGTQLWA
jgi:hypothetical protein